MTQPVHPASPPDGDEHKGAVEDDSPYLPGERPAQHGSLAGQLGHRNADDLTDGADSDYPEAGSNPEHSGEHKRSNKLKDCAE